MKNFLNGVQGLMGLWVIVSVISGFPVLVPVIALSIDFILGLLIVVALREESAKGAWREFIELASAFVGVVGVILWVAANLLPILEAFTPLGAAIPGMILLVFNWGGALAGAAKVGAALWLKFWEFIEFLSGYEWQAASDAAESIMEGVASGGDTVANPEG